MPQRLDISTTRLSDSYKYSHDRFYPPGLQYMQSYLEARKGARFKNTVFYGLQYILMAYLEGKVVTPRQVERDEVFFAAHFFGNKVYNKPGWSRIAELHNGKLPLRICAVPEGTVLGESNVLMTIDNLDTVIPWLTNFVETLSVQSWYPITVASLDRSCKEIWYKYLEMTGNISLLPFKHHDFGFRGVESVESAAIGGSAHLVNFKGTDTVIANDLILQFYCGKTIEEINNMSIDEYREFVNMNMPGFSICATEHSNITMWGEERELDACRNVLKRCPDGLVACVSDSWDIYNACEHIWGEQLKAEILSRNGIFIARPDSGDPLSVLPRIHRAFGKAFGYEVNSKNYKVINPKIGIIQGDGVEHDTLEPMLQSVVEDGWSIDSMATGSGGGLLQKVNRDTQRMAFKCSHAVIDGKEIDVYKRPATDPTKNSKRGKLALVVENGEYKTVPLSDAVKYPGGNKLVEVFNNGTVTKKYLFSDIRRRAELPQILEFINTVG